MTRPKTTEINRKTLTLMDPGKGPRPPENMFIFSKTQNSKFGKVYHFTITHSLKPIEANQC